MRIWCALFAAIWCLGASAEPRYLTDDELADWSGVGILTVPGIGGCSGVLLRPDLVLTAAHCVADAGKKTVAPAKGMYFSAGRAEDARAGAAWVRSVEIHPGYFSAGRRRNEAQIRSDVAQIRLKRPIDQATHFEIGPAPPLGATLTAVSYSEGRMRRASIQTDCRVVGRRTEFLELDCASAPGASGSPYFQIGRDGRARIVGIHSGRSRRDGQGAAQALGLTHVRGFLAAAPAGGGFQGAAPARAAPKLGETRRREGALTPGGSKPGDRLWRTD